MPCRILVVDDDVNALSGYLDFLAHEGFQVEGAADVPGALSLAFDNPPAAIITDIALPGMDGFILAEAIRHEARTHGVPVLGLTGQWSPEVTARATRAGMTAVLLKPCVPAHLLAELRRVLPRGVLP